LLLQCDRELGIDLVYSGFKVTNEFSSDSASAIEAIRSLAATETRYAKADLTHLFKIAYEEGKRAELQGRLLRVVSLLQVLSSTYSFKLLTGSFLRAGNTFRLASNGKLVTGGHLLEMALFSSMWAAGNKRLHAMFPNECCEIMCFHARACRSHAGQL
jgi:hypothetical protein